MKVNLRIFFIFIIISKTCYSQSSLVKQWDLRFGGTNNEELWAFQRTTDHGFILGGWSNSMISGEKSQANWDFFYLFIHQMLAFRIVAKLTQAK